MAEPGWPLIPREVLPAPVQPAQRGRRRTVATARAGRQLSIFGVEAADPSLFDLVGLLAGPGRLGRMGGTARVSVRVDAAWRVHVLAEELVARGLVVTWAPVAGEERDEPVAELTAEPVEQTMAADAPEAPAAERPDEESGEETAEDTDDEDTDEAPVGKKENAFEVRTAYSSRLNALARAWPPAADKLFLGGPRLRLWVAAAGEPRPQGYALGLDPDGFLDKATDAALTRAGLAGTIQAGPAYVIAGHRRLARLAELVGERPAAAPERLWPGGARA
ncbi:hypothetical protein ACIBSW_25800 [Actinoplanes sp. NPDC049668]|uniref:hypothetical protein n=1 Tax=unclassified Actinoplanes TaxID=2626549 RepID=UPI0033BD6A1B